MIEFLGWVGAILLAIQGVPQAYRSVVQGHAKGLEPTFIWMWCLGEVFLLPLIITTGSLPLILNYVLNVIITVIILYYMYFPRGQKEAT